MQETNLSKKSSSAWLFDSFANGVHQLIRRCERDKDHERNLKQGQARARVHGPDVLRASLLREHP
jgi:hypothetical protein